jgi:DNA-binding CsgD family transcriptional regulator
VQCSRGWWHTGQSVTRSRSFFSPTPAVVIRYVASPARAAIANGLVGKPVMYRVSTAARDVASVDALAGVADFPYRTFRGLADAAAVRRRDARVMLEEQLTERERKAAVLLAYGHTNRDVARQLDVSIRTAEAERAHLMRKLGLSRRSELVQWALERGLLR